MNDRQPHIFPWLSIPLLAVLFTLTSPTTSHAQLSTTEEERLQILSDPDAAKKKLEKERNRAPIEFYRSQIAPFDVLPYVKENHWSSLALELRSNLEDFDGYMQTGPMMMLGMPHEVIYRRDARMLKEARARLVEQVLLTKIPKEWSIDIIRPGAIRPDGIWQASLLPLESDQMLIVVLSKETTNNYAAWNRMVATIPTSIDRDSQLDIEKLRYYRLVLPMEPDKPLLSAHPLTWTTTSHVIWDGLSPEVLSVSHQQALLDWLHWGGQLIITGGAGLPYPIYKESFLGPYLPAEATGETTPLKANDLAPLADEYPPPTLPEILDVDENGQPVARNQNIKREPGRVYQPTVPITTADQRPVYFATLKPAPGSVSLPLAKNSKMLLAVERRVGRGRVTMLSFNPHEPALASWRGLDTLVRRIVLRRPEEAVIGDGGFENMTTFQPPRRGRLPGADLTWYRIASREGAPDKPAPPQNSTPNPAATAGSSLNPPDPTSTDEPPRPPGVADWRDSARFPTLARDLLEDASGITVPSSRFVLQVILAYLIAIVPLNWLVCRYLLQRREWAWIVVPVVALAFAIGVQRYAAYDMGFDSASDEIDLVEVQADYPRAHLTRFVSLYSTGRSSFTISYPTNPTALALPFDHGRSIRGEQISSSIWQSYPTPALVGMAVQPRSMSLVRGESMQTMTGPIRLEPARAGTPRQIVNASSLELRDAVLVEYKDDRHRTETFLGTISAGQTLELKPDNNSPVPDRVPVGPGPDPNRFLKQLRDEFEPRPENIGEIRLIAWTSSILDGQTIDPPVDRARGFTAVLVHLAAGALPDPNAEHYNLLARGPEPKRPTFVPPVDPQMRNRLPLPPGVVSPRTNPRRATP